MAEITGSEEQPVESDWGPMPQIPAVLVLGRSQNILEPILVTVPGLTEWHSV